MSEITLNPVRLYTEDDIYDMNTDNRPLVDIMSNIALINTQLSNFGFYLEAQSNPETEPVGGFDVNTCACLLNNDRLYPVDITKSVAEIDYQKYPIVLILGYNEQTNFYQCLTFSSLYNLNSKFPSFLQTSVGNPIVVGLGGQLVDSFYFNQYYANQPYQNIVVGKIVSTTEIAFGGNQVGVLGDNFYLAKNRDDSTSGLTTVNRDNQDSTIVFKSINLDTVGSPFVFAEFQNSFRPRYSISQLPVPVFFTNSTINYNQVSGEILDSDLDSKLNEVHFASPLLSPSNAQDVVYNSAGVTVGSLTNFTNSFLLHTSPYSTSLGELDQKVSSNLVFEFQNLTQTELLVKTPSVTRSIGTTVSQKTGIPSTLIPTSETIISGSTFGDYSQIGAYIGVILDDPTGISRLSTSDEDALAQTSGFNTVRLSDMANSSNLIINSKSDDSTILANTFITADGYIILNGANGVHVLTTPTYDSEVANKKYVDTKITAISSSVNQNIPLGGTNQDNAVSGLVAFDLTNNTSSTSQVLKFTTIGTTDIASSSIVRFTDSSSTPNPSGLVALNFFTSAANSGDPAYNALEGVNKGYLETRLTSGMTTGNYVSVAGAPQTITGVKEFTQLLTIDNNLYLKTTNATISTDGNFVEFIRSSGLPADTVKVKSNSTLVSDDYNVLTTKDYVDNKVSTSISTAIPSAWASWNSTDFSTGGVLTNSAPDVSSASFNSYVALSSSPNGNIYTVTKPCVLKVAMTAYMSSQDYVVSVELHKNTTVISKTGGGGGGGFGAVTHWATGLNYWRNYDLDTFESGASWSGQFESRNTLVIDSLVSCVPGDTLQFVMAENQQVKSSGVLNSLTANGYFQVIS